MTERSRAPIKPWAVCLVQANWENYNPNLKGELEGEAFKKRNLEMMCAYIDACFSMSPRPKPVRLVCFPEFSIGGMYGRNTTTEEVKKYEAITIPGPETEVLAEKARQYNTYIAAVNHENDPVIPDYFFNTAFIINPKGKIILKYRKLNNLYGCNPHDIYDKYVNPITGKKDFFPVVDTEIGRLSVGICADIYIPEIPKVFALKGADIWLHLTSSRSWLLDTHLLIARALDNTIYVAHENWASRVLTTLGEGAGKFSTHIDSFEGGGCMVIDPFGRILSEANGTAEQLVVAEIDVEKLREKRKVFVQLRGDNGNSLAWTRTELFRQYYNRTIFPPNGVLRDGPMKHSNDETLAKRRSEAMENLKGFLDFYYEEDVE
jgi:predicted amidohydrolase